MGEILAFIEKIVWFGLNWIFMVWLVSLAQFRQHAKFEVNPVFLPENSERKLVCNLLTNNITYEEFLESEINSENRTLIAHLVEMISLSWPDEMSQPYSRSLANISKYSSVAGFLQVLSEEPLVLLADFQAKFSYQGSR